MRDRLFAELPAEWHAAYEAGMFTEFMEQRAPGHTVLDDKIYRERPARFQNGHRRPRSRALDFLNDPRAYDKREALKSFGSACDAVILFAERHAALARETAPTQTGSAPSRGVGEDRRACARTCRHTRRGISRRRSSTTGSATWP